MNVKNKAAQAAVKAELSLVDAIDNIQCPLLKAQALIAITFGESGETFRNMGDDYQDRILWTISDLVTEATNAATEVAALGGLQA